PRRGIMAARVSKLLAVVALIVLSPLLVSAQSTYTAQLSGTVTDASGGVVVGAEVILTDDAPSVSTTSVADDHGVHVCAGVRPATYTLRVETAHFAAQERKGVELAVTQQANINFTVTPGEISERVTVTEQAPLLDTGNATLGTDVSNQYVR